MRISDWSSDVCSSDLAISKGNGASGAFAILTELKRRLAEIAQAKALTSQLSAGVFCDQLDVDGAGLARQAELGSPHKAWQYRVARHGLDQPDGRIVRTGFPFPFFGITDLKRRIGDEDLARLLGNRPAGELVDEPGLARGKEAHPVRGKLRRHRDVDVPAHRFMGDRESIVGIGARDLQIGRASCRERVCTYV